MASWIKYYFRFWSRSVPRRSFCGHKMIMKKLMLFFLFINSCVYLESSNVNYVNYYDKEKGIKRVEGQFVGGLESGHWKYYSQDGIIMQEGSYQDGLNYGEWKYNNIYSIRSIYWKRIENGSIVFSVPATFIDKTELSATSSKIYIDTLDKTILSLSIIGNVDSTYLENYYDENIGSLSQSFSIEHGSSKVISTDSTKFYLDEIQFKNDTQIVKQFMCYKLINPSTIFIVSVTNKSNHSDYLKFLIGEIFNHSFIDRVRVNNPHEVVFD
jgi:antitoxin component YwqK of YwqJK toxin-antitoxin module